MKNHSLPKVDKTTDLSECKFKPELDSLRCQIRGAFIILGRGGALLAENMMDDGSLLYISTKSQGIMAVVKRLKSKDMLFAACIR